VSELERKSRLADATRTDQRNEPHVACADQVDELLVLALAPNQSRCG